MKFIQKRALTGCTLGLIGALLSVANVARAETVCGLSASKMGTGDIVEMKWPGTDWQPLTTIDTSLIHIGWVGWYPYNYKRDALPKNVIVLIRMRNGDRKGSIRAVCTADASQGGDAHYGIVLVPQLTW